MADLTITPASVQFISGHKLTGVAGNVGITAGMAVYLDPITKTYKKTNAAGLIAAAQCTAIALNGASTGQPIVVLQANGKVNLGTGVVGQTYIASPNNAGTIAPISDVISGVYIIVIGVAESASVFDFHVVNPDVLTP